MRDWRGVWGVVGRLTVVLVEVEVEGCRASLRPVNRDLEVWCEAGAAGCWLGRRRERNVLLGTGVFGEESRAWWSVLQAEGIP
jgi:hypothetical protein